MSYSSNRNLVVEAASWTVAAGIFAAALLNFDQLRLFTASVAGIDLKAAQAAQPPKSAGAQDSRSGSVVELRAGHNGHFETEAEINGRAVQVMVDTGATGVALSYEDAETAGIYVKDSDFTHQSSTANGIAQIALVNIDRISIGDITVRNVQGMVLDRGKLKGTLLGMSFLSRLSRVDMRQGTLVLHD